MKELPRNILFDLGGVIEKISPVAVAEEFKKLGMQEPGKFFSISGQSRLCEDFELGKIDSNFFIESIKMALPKATDYQIINAWNANLLGVTSDTIETLQSLKRKGHALYILSNTNALHFDAITEKFRDAHQMELSSLFDQIFLSFKIGLRKPTEAFFKAVLDKLALSLNPSQAIFIDDLAPNTSAAEKLGLKTHTHKTNEPISYLESGLCNFG